MKALLHQPFNAFYETVEPSLDSERASDLQTRQLPGRTLSWQLTRSYPSPPMSSPPSPRRKLSDVPSTTAAIFDPTTSASYYTGVTVGLSPVLAVTTTSTSVLPQPWINTSDPIAPPATFFSHTSSSSIESQAPLTRIESTSSATAVIDVQAIAGPSTATLPPSAGRGGGRRSKTHVANACNNCKRAHLSCDVDRPCNRCVQTGKGVCQPSCTDLRNYERTANLHRTPAGMCPTKNEEDLAYAMRVISEYSNSQDRLSLHKGLSKPDHQPQQIES